MERESQDFRMQLHARYKAARARMRCDRPENRGRIACRPPLRPISATPGRMPPSIAEIRRIVATFFGLTLEQLDSRSRKNPLLEARRAAMHFCVRFGHSRVKVGRAFAGRDHTSIIDALRKFEAMRDPALLNKLEALRIMLGLASPPKTEDAASIAIENTTAPITVDAPAPNDFASSLDPIAAAPEMTAKRKRVSRVCVTTKYFPNPAPGLREKLAEMKDVRLHARDDDSHGFDGW